MYLKELGIIIQFRTENLLYLLGRYEKKKYTFPFGSIGLWPKASD